MGKKLESNFTNMVVVLFSVTLIASAAVGYVYSLTAGPIEADAHQDGVTHHAYGGQSRGGG